MEHRGPATRLVTGRLSGRCRQLPLLVVAGIGLLLVACSGGEDDPGAEANGGEGVFAAIIREPLPADPGPDVEGLRMQESILADDRVTFADYERAVRATVECIREQGFAVDGPTRFPDAPIIVVEPGADPSMRFVWTFPDVPEQVVRDEVAEGCRAQWSYWVERAWELQNEPSEQDIQDWLERAWQCARDRDLALSDPPTEEDATAAIAAGCRPWEGSG